MADHWLVIAVWYLKWCEFLVLSTRLAQPICLLNNDVGRCVDAPSCPMGPTALVASVNASQKLCDNGKVCCIVSAKIVTPNNAVAPITGPLPSSTGEVQTPNVPPLGINLPAETPPVAMSPYGNSALPSGLPPPSVTNPSGPLPNPSDSSPADPSANGAGPLSNNSDIIGEDSYVEVLSVPTSLMLSNIVADPGILPSPPDNSDTVAISAEVVNSATEMFDAKCDMYYSMIQPNMSAAPAAIQGNRSPVVMIFGGVDTEDKEFPHMAALGFGTTNAIQWLCAGSLITENFVLTAAHCLSSPPLGDVQFVKLGSKYLIQDGPNVQLLNVVKRTPHNQYDSHTQYNDIALLQLNRPVTINSYVAPICLFSSTNYEDRNLVATGWGKTETSALSLTLKKVGLELFSQQECQAAYSVVSRDQLPLGIQQAIQVCAGGHSQSKDTCQGDSGGPLQIRKNNRWYLIGITSIGLQCGQINVPGIYTRVAPYLQWIQQNI